MTRLFIIFGGVLCSALPAFGQSLHLERGERAVEGSIGWSVGPASKGVEGFVGVALDGRFDVGLGFNRYTFTFDDGSDSSFTEYAPFVRAFLLKEQTGAPLSLAASGQWFIDDYGTGDSGQFVQIGMTLYKEVHLTDRWSLHPFGGFAFVAESYTFGGGPADRAQYLTRDLGLHFTRSVNDAWLLRLTLLEQSFRRETYRGARVAVVRRL